MTDRTNLTRDPSNPGRLRGAWSQHVRALRLSVRRLRQASLGAALSVAVIGISLALPATLALALDNARSLGDHYRSTLDMSVFLTAGLSHDATTELRHRIESHPDLLLIRLITPAEGLAEFREWSGLGNAIDALPDNPLPTVMVVRPRELAAAPSARLSQLAAQLRAWKGVDQVVTDTAWASKLSALTTAVERALQVLWVLLGMTALLVIGNTIRLELDQHREEIAVIALLGASQRYLRRPYLYSGLWYGAGGGLVAIGLCALSASLLAGPVSMLAKAYGGSFHLHGPDFTGCLRLILTGTLLGWVGAWIATYSELRRMDRA